jgi:hypothetical protein
LKLALLRTGKLLFCQTIFGNMTNFSTSKTFSIADWYESSTDTSTSSSSSDPLPHAAGGTADAPPPTSPTGPNRPITVRSILAAKSPTEKPGVMGPAVDAELAVVADKLIDKAAHAVCGYVCWRNLENRCLIFPVTQAVSHSLYLLLIGECDWLHQQQFLLSHRVLHDGLARLLHTCCHLGRPLGQRKR